MQVTCTSIQLTSTDPVRYQVDFLDEIEQIEEDDSTGESPLMMMIGTSEDAQRVRLYYDDLPPYVVGQRYSLDLTPVAIT